MRPSHAPKPFTANREFTDRDDAKELFRKAFDGSQSRDAYRVLNWYGVGGEGKSGLSKKLMAIADEIAKNEGKAKKVARARVDLDDRKFRRIDEAVLSIRLQLARTFGASFPCFDTAFARYFKLTNPGINIRKKHEELFKGENELLDNLIDFSEGGVAEAASTIAAEAASTIIPGLNLLYRYGARLSHRVHEWFQRRGKDVLKGLDDLTPDELQQRLPGYLGADICDCLACHDKARVLIILDTYEALWRDFNIKDTVLGARADVWVRTLVQDAPGVLFLIFGRDKLRWPEIYSEWDPVVQSHRLGELSDSDADLFLKKVPIIDSSIRQKIVQSAKGLPFYLDLQVTLYERLMQETLPSAEQFGGNHPEILRRFLDHLSEAELTTVRLASYQLKLTEEGMNELAEWFMGGLGNLNWGWLSRQSFISEDEDGGFLMHALMRVALQQMDQLERPQTFRTVHRRLFERYDALSVAPSVGLVTHMEETAFIHASHHLLRSDLERFFDWFWERVPLFRKAAHFGFLENLFRDVISAIVPHTRHDDADILSLRHDLARQIGNQGRYGEAERELRAIWEIERRPEVLGEEHPDTLATLHDLARQIGSQGRYGEAEKEFRAIWEILRRPEVLGEEHPDTLTTRHNLAHQIGNQGRYGEAERELRAIWEIERRPEVLGEEHPGTLATRHDLAQQIGNQGRYGEAEKEFRAIWEIERRPEVLGEEHPHTLITRHNLAHQIGNQGRYGEAEKEFRAIWEIQRRPEVLGEEHPHTLRTLYHLAKMLDARELNEEAYLFLEGLEDKMLKSVIETHRWMVELRQYLLVRRN